MTAAIALLMSGCGSTASRSTTTTAQRTLDPTAVEQAIAQSIQSQRHQSAAVTCPPGQPLAAGQRFRCVAQVGAQITPFVVTETNGSGHVTYQGVAASSLSTVSAARVALAIERSVSASQHVHVTVLCPSGIPLQQGLSFVCVARAAGGRTTDFEVSQTDGDGHVTYRGT